MIDAVCHIEFPHADFAGRRGSGVAGFTLAESLLGIKLADDELTKIETLDQLRAHFRGRMTEIGKSAA